MFDTIEELVSEAIADGGYDEEFTDALETELNQLAEIKEELYGIRRDSELLYCLKVTGVENWVGFEKACQMMEEE